jgi:hypothetical protein
MNGKSNTEAYSKCYVSRLRLRGAMDPLPHTSSWRSVLLGTGTLLPLHLEEDM